MPQERVWEPVEATPLGGLLALLLIGVNVDIAIRATASETETILKAFREATWQ